MKLRWLPDITTGKTTSYLTRPPKHDSQVIGYSHLAKLSKDERQVDGYHSLLVVPGALSASLVHSCSFDGTQGRFVGSSE
jgi:hypothetical protein